MLSLALLASLLLCLLSNVGAVAVPTAVQGMGIPVRPEQRLQHWGMGPEPTKAPSGPRAEDLRRRDYTVTIGSALLAPDNTLGYYTSGTSTGYYGAYTCGYGTAVIVFPDNVNTIAGYVGCCPAGQNCQFVTTCIDSSAYYSKSACDSICSKDTQTLVCTAYAHSYCNLVTFAGLSVSVWGCASSSSNFIQLYTTSPGQTTRTFKTTNLIVTNTGTPPPSRSTDAASGSGGGGLSTPAKIGVGVGAGVGGLLAIGGLIFLLFKLGVFAGAGAGAAGAGIAGGVAGGVAGAAAAAGGAASAANGTQPGMAKMGFSSDVSSPYSGASNFSSPAPTYAPPGAQGGYFPGGSEFTSQGAGGTGFSGGYPGPTGAEGNFSAPAYPTGTEAGNFSAPGYTGGAESGASNFSAPGGMSGGGPPVAPPNAPPNPAYFAAPAAVAPLAAGAALLATRRKQVGSSVSGSPPPAGGPPTAQPQMQQYVPPNSQYEMGGEGVYRGSEMGSPEPTYMSAQSTGLGSYGTVSEIGTPAPTGGYAPPSGPPPGHAAYEMHSPPNAAGYYMDPNQPPQRH